MPQKSQVPKPPPPPRQFSFFFLVFIFTSSSLNKSSQSLTKKKLTFPHLPENPSPLRLSPPTTQKHYHLNLSKKTPKESSRNTSNKKLTNRRSYIMFLVHVTSPLQESFSTNRHPPVYQKKDTPKINK